MLVIAKSIGQEGVDMLYRLSLKSRLQVCEDVVVLDSLQG